MEELGGFDLADDYAAEAEEHRAATEERRAARLREHCQITSTEPLWFTREGAVVFDSDELARGVSLDPRELTGDPTGRQKAIAEYEYSRGRYEEALAACREVLGDGVGSSEREPRGASVGETRNRRDAACVAARCLARLGRPAEALPLLQPLVDGGQRVDCGAIACYQKYISAVPEEPRGWIALGRAYLERSRAGGPAAAARRRRAELCARRGGQLIGPRVRRRWFAGGRLAAVVAGPGPGAAAGAAAGEGEEDDDADAFDASKL
eukprot:tig00001041_g6544.t1